MWTYILRRMLLMIPTLFGVTVVTFLIMKCAPGDPLANQLGSAGMAGKSDQTRDAYLIRKRDFKLDKPWIFNVNYFRDYSGKVHLAAWFLGTSEAGIAEELGTWVEPIPLSELPDSPDEPKVPDEEGDPEADSADEEDVPKYRLKNLSGEPERLARYVYVRHFPIEQFEKRLADPRQHGTLARAIDGFAKIDCEDFGQHGVPVAMDILEDASCDSRTVVGAIRGLRSMVIEPFRYTYSRDPKHEETPTVLATWRTWWESARDEFPAIAPERRKRVLARFNALLDMERRVDLFDGLSYFDPKTEEPFERADMRVFIERLLDAGSSPELSDASIKSMSSEELHEKMICSVALRLYVGKPLRIEVDVAPDAPAPPSDEDASDESTSTDDATDLSPEEALAAWEKECDTHQEHVDEARENWLVHYELQQADYQPAFLSKVRYILTDTQYATVLGRLVTFRFGRSTLKTREPVSSKLVRAVLVSAPLMLMAQIIIYLVAIPAGIVCAVNRDGWKDRTISLGLFLLYSIPPFVAGMLLLLFLSFHLNLFPVNGLHGESAENYGFVAYMIDYLWHAILPVLCLSLFSLAAMAMYSRSSMLDVINQDYIRTARAKGLDEDTVIFKHGLRNALIPIVTLFSSFLPAMLGGSVLIEIIFGIPGMGRLAWESIELKDLPTMTALLYIDAIAVMLSILMTDLLYVVVDPRIGFERQGGAA